MKPVSFRVTKYRNIQDSGEVALDEHLTCLVGKNQSGKTSLLKALHKFNPHEPEPYDLRRDWPRGQRRSKDESQVVCAVKFRLAREDVDVLSGLTDVALPGDVVEISKDYAGNFEFTFGDPDPFPERLHPNEIDAAVTALPQCSPQVPAEFREVAEKCWIEAQRLAKEGRFADLENLAVAQEALLRPLVGPQQTTEQVNATNFTNGYVAQLKALKAKLASGKTMRQRAHEALVARIPTFIYMSDYNEFEGSALLPQVRERKKQKRLTGADETFLMILSLAGLDLDKLIEQGESKEKEVVRDRQYDLDDGARSLTNDVAGRWGQNPYKVEFRVDGQTFLTEIEEVSRNVGLIPLEQQSKGFQWFFSFDLRFMHDSDGTFENCVLLLDEPGLHLHPGGQKDLLRRLDAYAQKNTLLYTTHLPFLVDLRDPTRIRVMTSEEGGYASVSDDLSRGGKDERLTLQAALGMQLDQHYLVAQRNLIVEGVDDFLILTELSNLMERSSRPGLAPDVRVSPAGGAPEAVYLATYMIGQELEVCALFDSDDAGRTAEGQLRKKWLTKYNSAKASTALLGTWCEESRDFAIEDLFPEDFYLQRFVSSHKHQAGVDKVKLDSADPLLGRRLAAACERAGVHFNKGSVAKAIARDLRRMVAVAELPQVTTSRAEKLFASLAKAFPEEERCSTEVWFRLCALLPRNSNVDLRFRKPVVGYCS